MRTLALAAALAATVTAAHGHDAPMGWRYSGGCCNSVTEIGGDCAPIPHTAIRYLPDGMIEVTLRPGDHPLVTEAQHYLRSERLTYESGDEFYHACLHPAQDKLHCLYVPQMAF